MAASQSQHDEMLCEKYAFFASHLDRWHFNVLYWCLFMTNLVVLFIASWLYIRGQDALERHAQDTRKRAKSLRESIYLCMGCVLLSTVCVVIEAYALLALQFCEGEDLMSLYWATWTMIQIGSWIAMMGIILALAHAWRDRKHPPWALALGTPVLVIAGFLYLIHDCTSKRVKKKFLKQEVNSSLNGSSSSNGISNSIQINTEADVEVQGDLVGFGIDGGPIVRLHDAVSSLPIDFQRHGEILGVCNGNRPIVAFGRESIRFANAPV